MENGGRWNQRGVALVYTSENRALATLEFVVHVSLSVGLRNLSIGCYEIPDDLVPDQIPMEELPKKWRVYPAPPKLAEIGSAWAVAKRSLLLRVPSAIVPSEFNILINPKHHEMARVTISHIEKFAFDKRLL